MSFALLVLAMTGCDEAAIAPHVSVDPCDRKGACEVSGVDLVIDRFTYYWPASSKIDSQTGLHYVQKYDSIHISYTFRNRGDHPSEAAAAWVMNCNLCSGIKGREVPIRALAPGEIDSGTVTLPAAQVEATTAVQPRVTLELTRVPDEPFYRNNEKVLEAQYLVVAPEISGEIQFLNGPPRVGATARFVMTLRNRARLGIQPEREIAFCFRRIDLSYGIDTCHRASGQRMVPALQPGESRIDTIALRVTQQSYYYEKHTAIPVHFDACYGGRVSYVTQPCAAGVRTTLLPDVESACVIPDLALDSDSSASFQQPCYVYLGQFNVWRMKLEGGKAYRAVVTSNFPVGNPLFVGFWDKDGKLVSAQTGRTALVTFADAGTYYLVVSRSFYTNFLEYTVRVSAN